MRNSNDATTELLRETVRVALRMGMNPTQDDWDDLSWQSGKGWHHIRRLEKIDRAYVAYLHEKYGVFTRFMKGLKATAEQISRGGASPAPKLCRDRCQEGSSAFNLVASIP
jgi:hypothetical protein